MVKTAGAALLAAVVVFMPQPATAAQQFQLAMSGFSQICYFESGPYYLPLAWFSPDSFMSDMASAMDTIASGDGQTVFGIPHRDAPGSIQIVQIEPDGSQTAFFDGLAGYSSHSMVVARTGRVFVNVVNATTSGLATVSPAGTLEGLYPGVHAEAVGADGCTLFYAKKGGIGRVNGCTGASLPDFVATNLPPGLPFGGGLQVTGNGEVIVASYRSVGLYDSAGNVRTLVDLNALGYNTSEYSVEQIALSPDGASVWVALGGCFKSPVFLVASLADGSVFRSPLSDRSYNSYMNFVTGIGGGDAGRRSCARTACAFLAGRCAGRSGSRDHQDSLSRAITK